MLKELGLMAEIEVASAVETKTMGGDLALMFLEDKNKKLHQATGLDLLLYGDARSWTNFQALAKQITLEESMTMMLPLFYEVLYRGIERDPDLARISTGDIMRLTGLEKKIKPCASM